MVGVAGYPSSRVVESASAPDSQSSWRVVSPLCLPPHLLPTRTTPNPKRSAGTLWVPVARRGRGGQRKGRVSTASAWRHGRRFAVRIITIAPDFGKSS